MNRINERSWELTDQLVRLLGPDHQERNDEWLNQTGTVAYMAALVVRKEGFTNTDDGKTYLCMDIPESRCSAATTIEVMASTILKRKAGIFVGDPSNPYLWLSHGSILSLFLYGEVSPPKFYGYVQPDLLTSTLPSRELRGNTPNEQMLPALVRESVRYFFKTKGIKRSGVVSLLNESGVPVLFFELPCDRNDTERQKELYFGLSWYMPSCIPYAGVPSGVFERGFPDL